MTSSLFRLAPAALALAILLPSTAQAHKMWLVPSATVVSGESPWVGVDAAVSNSLFYPDHFAMRLDGITITAPDGSQAALQNPHMGKYRSVFDLALTQKGTYRISNASTGLIANWKENGESRRWRGTPETFATEVPKNAEDLRVTQASNRVETFVTNGAPDTGALQTTGSGLELVAITHPNDLFAGEAASFRLLIDGEPAADTQVSLIRGESRYRDNPEEITTKTDAEGRFSVTWPVAGMYWLNASVQDDKTTAPATSRRASYVATLEVLPQ